MSIPRECFDKILEFFKRKYLRAAHINFTMGFTKISKTRLYELICHPNTEEDQTKTVFFMKKISFINKNWTNLGFKIIAIIMELRCNSKNHKSQIYQIFLDQTDFFHETDWFSLVLLYMWLTYELIDIIFSAPNKDFRFLEILAIVNPTVN